MYCAKLTLIDRRHSTAVAVRASKSKHATGTGFKRNCLIKELASRTNNKTARNRYAAHDVEPGTEEEAEDAEAEVEDILSLDSSPASFTGWSSATGDTTTPGQTDHLHGAIR